MNSQTYCWSLLPEQGIELRLRVTAPSAAAARRTVHRFLADHDGEGWGVECVSRENAHPTHWALPVAPARSRDRGERAVLVQ